MVREAQEAVMTIYEGVNEMRHIVANTKLNLYCGVLQEIRKIKHLETALTKNEIAYCGSVMDVSLSKNIPRPSISVFGL